MMNTQKTLLFCLLASGQLLAMEEKSQALSKNGEQHAAVESHTSFWGPVGLAVGAVAGAGTLIYRISCDASSSREVNRRRIADLSPAALLTKLQEMVSLKSLLDKTLHVREFPNAQLLKAVFQALSDDEITLLGYWRALDGVRHNVENSSDVVEIIQHYIRDLDAVDCNQYFTDANLSALKNESGLPINTAWFADLKATLTRDEKILRKVANEDSEQKNGLRDIRRLMTLNIYSYVIR